MLNSLLLKSAPSKVGCSDAYGLAANTALVYGYFIADSRSFFRHRTFWAATGAALTVHLIIFVVVLAHVAQWKLLWFMVMLLEIPVLVFVRDRLPGRGSK
jgi:hypothetical protein